VSKITVSDQKAGTRKKGCFFVLFSSPSLEETDYNSSFTYSSAYVAYTENLHSSVEDSLLAVIISSSLYNHPRAYFFRSVHLC